LIKEDFLHYLWNLKLFKTSNLVSTTKETIQIINSGIPNSNSGPDFFNAKIKIDNQLWAGNIEIHIKSSDWFVHNHEKDLAYDNVILHVVWEDDIQIFRKDNSVIPTLVLKDYVDLEVLKSYQKLFTKKQVWINCEKEIAQIDGFILDNWLERLYLERLQSKSELILDLLKQSNNDWEAVLFKLLAKNFGLKVNGDSFLQLANSFDFSVFRKNQDKVENLEALLFGQSALLSNDFEDVYFQNLKVEYSFLKTKYKLTPIHQSELKFFRLRPNNFPTIRLSQLAKLYFTHQNLFSKLLSVAKIDNYYSLLQVSTTKYWETHYSFKTTSKQRTKKLTKSFIDLLLINTIIPLRFVYQKYIGKLDEELILQLIQQIKPEKNSIITKFNSLNIKTKNALKTQAFLQLKNEYCDKNKCLQCAVGTELLVS
jgi:hypothetical protein